MLKIQKGGGQGSLWGFLCPPRGFMLFSPQTMAVQQLLFAVQLLQLGQVSIALLGGCLVAGKQLLGTLGECDLQAAVTAFVVQQCLIFLVLALLVRVKGFLPSAFKAGLKVNRFQ